MEIIINKIAIWTPVVVDGLLVKSVPDGTDYHTDGSSIPRKSRGMIRYGKNYETEGGVKYCLFVRTNEKDSAMVEELLDKAAALVSDEYAREALIGASIEHFVYTDWSLEALA